MCCHLIAAILLVFAPSVAPAQESAAFLKILPGARPMAMGQAFTALADDLNALATNPAGLSRINLKQAAFMHAELFDDTRFDFIGYSQPLAGSVPIFGGGTVGLGLERLSQGSLQGRDINRQPTGSFGAADTALNLAYSFRLPGMATMFGTNLKFIDSQLANASANTLAADFGVLVPGVAELPLALGASVNNLGPGIRYASQTDELPLTFSLGAAVNAVGSLIISADVHHLPYSNMTSFGIGTEYALLPIFSLRAGYLGGTSLPLNGGSPILTGPLNGLGFGFGVTIRKATLDYAFSPAGELGNAQRLSLSTRF